MNNAAGEERDRLPGGVSGAIRVGLALFAVALVVAMFPVSPRPAIDVKIALYQVTALVLGGAWLGAVAMGRLPIAWPRAFGPAVLLMLAAQAFSLLAAEHPAQGYVQLSQSLCLAVLSLVASQVYRTAAEARPLLIAFCVGVGLSTLYAFAQKAGYDPFPWDASQRQTSTYLELPGTLGNPNIAGHALILVLVFAAYLATHRKTRWCVVFVPLFAAHLYLTHFRSGVLALGAGMAVAVLAWAVTRTRLTAVWTARATVTGALAAAMALAGLFAVYAASSRHGAIDDSILLRFNAYYGAANMIADRPVMGFGLGRYAAENPPYWTDFEQRWLAEKHLMNEHVHCDVLETWVETGAGGVFAYVWLLVVGVYGAARQVAATERGERRFALALVAFFVAFAADGLFGFNGRVPVTAALLFLVAGVSEGVWGAKGRRFVPRPPVRILAGFLFVALAASAAIGVRDFLASVSLQSARNALAFNALTAADGLSTRALRLAPYLPQAHATRAELELESERPGGAVAHYDAALESRPYDVPILLGLARAELSVAVEAAARGDRETSIGALERTRAAANRALDLCRYLPDGAETLARAALAEAHLRDDERAPLANQAETHVLAALRNGAENVAALFVLAADCRTVLGDEEGAEQYLVRAIDVEPEDSLAWEAFLRFAGRTQRFDGLSESLDRAVARAEKQGRADWTGRLIAWRARALLLQGQSFATVAEAFEGALAVAPNAGKIWEDYAAAARFAAAEDRFVDTVQRVETGLPNVMAVRAAYDGDPVAAANDLHALAVDSATPGGDDLNATEIAWALDCVQSALVATAVGESGLIDGLVPIAAAYEVLDWPEQAAATYQVLAKRSTGTTRTTAAIKAGALLVRLSRAGEAVGLLEDALSADGNNVALRIEYARALTAAGKPAAARLELNTLLTQFNLDPAQRAAVEAELNAR